MNKKSINIKTIMFVSTVICAMFVAGCASELNDSRNLKQVKEENQHAANPLDIKSSPDLYDTNKNNVFDNKLNPDSKTSPVFTAEKGTGQVVNPNPQQISRGEKGPGTVTLNFENADLREVVKFIMTDLLKQNYIIAPNVQGKVTLQTSNPLAKEDLLPTLETLLKLNGAVLFQDGGLIKIMPQAEANRGNIVPKSGRMTKLKPGYEIRIIPLKYLSATQAQKTLEPFLPVGSLLQVDAARNILTIAGTSQELANIQQTIDTFDVDWLKGMSIGIYRLQNVSIEDVMPELDSLFGEGGNTPFAGLFRFISMDKMNSIMVITPQPKYLTEAERWLERLDRSGNADSERLYVYRVQNGRAEDLAGVLSSIFGGGSSTSSSSSSSRDKQVAPGSVGASASSNKNGSSNNGLQNRNSITNNNKTGSNNSSNNSNNKNKNNNNNKNNTKNGKSSSGNSVSDVTATIVADETNNSLIIKATPVNYDLVLQALRQVDVPKLQVLLDVVVAEITLKDNLQYGFKFWLNDNDPSGNAKTSVNFNGNASGANPGFNYTMIAGKIGVDIQALAEKGLAQFLSTPSLMVLDNETATLDVGSQISVSGDSTVSTDGSVITQSNSYLSTGVTLSVTPRVNAGGSIVLDLTQTVSRADRTSVGSSNNPDIYNRSITSSISALDGQTVVIGGLIQQDNSTNRSGVPYLSDIPVLGALFRGTVKDTNRTELVVLVTPHVSRNNSESLEITKEFMSRMKSLEIFNNKGVLNKK